MLNLAKHKIGALARKIKNLLFSRRRHYARIRETTVNYDIFKKADEQFFCRLYLEHITAALGPSARPGQARILDAGCGHGRLSIPLAKLGYNVRGVDFTREAIGLARQYAAEAGVQVEWETADISAFLKKSAGNCYDCVLCTEVVYMLPDYHEIIAGLVRVLKPGGLLALSVRPKLFNVLNMIMGGDLDKAAYVAAHHDGNAIKWYFNWFTKETIGEKLAGSGIEDIKCYGIGIAAGIEGDPQACFTRPSLLDEAGREKLFKIENDLAPVYPDAGRYLLATGRKRK